MKFVQLLVVAWFLCACGGTESPENLGATTEVDTGVVVSEPRPDTDAGRSDPVDSSIVDAVPDASVIVDVKLDSWTVDVRMDSWTDVNAVDVTVDVRPAVDAISDVAPALPIGCGPGMRYTIENVIEVRDNEQHRLWRPRLGIKTFGEAAQLCSNQGFSLATVAELTAISGSSWAGCAWKTDIFAWTGGPTTTDKATVFLTMNYGKDISVKLIPKTAPAHVFCVIRPK